MHESEACREYVQYVYAGAPKDIGQSSTFAAAPNSSRLVCHARCSVAGSRSPARRERQPTMSTLGFHAIPERSQKECTTCTQINESLVEVCSNSVAKLLPSWQYQLTTAAMQYTAPSCWQHSCISPARQASLASTCSALPTQRLCPPCGIARLRLLPLHARLGIQICPTRRFVRSRASASESSIPSEVKLCSLDPST